ncbi:Hypothetical protein CINCED_3A014302 [Cinara cedri]|uniref:Uncharacterized protein n=1 Tax=Cinara cedri TaxID=506608 RepID=A0A5E4M9W2_9HEMI|nr:Hypothetical protein CINCED_3A014302 [Cinara cedri]
MLHFFTIEDSPPTKERGIFGPALRDSEVRSSGVYCLDVNECFGPKVQKAIYSPVEELNDEHAIPQNAKKPKMEELKSDHLDLGLGNTQLTIAEIRKSVSALEKILKR